MPKSVVTAAGATASARHRDGRAGTLVYEVHLRGFSMRMDGIPEAERGRFAGLASAPAIAYLKALGIGSVELLPVQYFADEPALTARGLRNYWGYNSIGFFAPHNRYGSPEEFRVMVARLHDAGIEVLLDVVYNHTAEGESDGPFLCFRGIDNRTYYMLAPGGEYYNYSGCGNTLNCNHPVVRDFIVDCLRYWVEEFHVDGFRFDLAPIMTRAHSAWHPAQQGRGGGNGDGSSAPRAPLLRPLPHHTHGAAAALASPALGAAHADAEAALAESLSYPQLRRALCRGGRCQQGRGIEGVAGGQRH
jgi:glycogen debranching enzyme GlgX